MAQKPTPEFRAEAVRIALTSGLSRSQVAANLKRFAKNLKHRFGAKRPEPVDVVGVSKPTCASS